MIVKKRNVVQIFVTTESFFSIFHSVNKNLWSKIRDSVFSQKNPLK